MFFLIRSFFKRYPKRFLTLFLTQIFFNFSFFGLKSLFVLYTINQFSFTPQEAFELFAALMALSYATSLLGGWLADHFIGAKSALLIGGLLSITGVVLLMLPFQDGAFLGMTFLSLGSGCFKPTFSTLLSLLFKDPADPRKDEAFTNLYIAMNIGSFTGPFICSLAHTYMGWVGGLIPVIFSFGLGSYLFFRYTSYLARSLKKRPASYPWLAHVILLIAGGLIYFLFKYRLFFDALMSATVCLSFLCFGALFYRSTPEERKGLKQMIPYVLLFTFFCALFEQAGSSLMVFFDRMVDRKLGTFTIPSEALLSLNPLFILLLGKWVSAGVSYVEGAKKPLDGLTKFSIGFFFIGLSFMVLALGDLQKEQGSVSLNWMLFSLFLQAIGEIFIIPIGFATISKLAPPRYMGLVMGLWLMAIAYGHYLAGILARFLLTLPPALSQASITDYRTFFFNIGFLSLSTAVLLTANNIKNYSFRRK